MHVVAYEDAIDGALWTDAPSWRLPEDLTGPHTPIRFHYGFAGLSALRTRLELRSRFYVNWAFFSLFNKCEPMYFYGMTILLKAHFLETVEGLHSPTQADKHVTN